MRTDERSQVGQIAVQPETKLEQDLIVEAFVRLQEISQAHAHPNAVGTKTVFYTLDLQEFDELNHELWKEAEINVDGNGRLDPDPGSRALVVVHDPDSLVGKKADVGDPGGDDERADVGSNEDDGEFQDFPDTDGDAPSGDETGSMTTGDMDVQTDEIDIENSLEKNDIPEEASAPDGVEALHHRNPMMSVATLLQEGDPEYSDLQEAAKAAQGMGYDIPANQAYADLVDDLEKAVEDEISQPEMT